MEVSIFMRPTFRSGFILFLSAHFASIAFAQAPAQTVAKTPVKLEVGKSVEGELRGGEFHSYSFDLSNGQFAEVVVEQRGIDVVVTAYGPDAKQIGEIDSPNGSNGPEPISVLARASGVFRLEVRSLEPNAPAGRYDVLIKSTRDATVQDRTGDLAERLIAAKSESERADLMSSENSFVTPELAKGLNERGMRFFERGDYPTALAVIQLAQNVAVKINDKIGLFHSANNTGSINQMQGRHPQALELYQKALAIAESVNETRLILFSLGNIGNSYYFQGQLERASEYFQKALVIAEATGDKRRRASVYNGLGNVNKDQAKYQEALEYYRKSLAINEELDDKPNIAGTFNNMGLVYDALANYQLSLEYLQKGLKVREAIGNPVLIGFSLNNIGNLNRNYGHYSEALDNFRRTRELFLALGANERVGIADSNTATVLVMQGNYSSALEAHKKSLAMFEELGAKPRIARSLANIGNVYHAQNDFNQALIYYERALPLLESVGSKADVALTLGNLGSLHTQIGDYEKAASYLNKSVAMHEASGNKQGVAGALVNLAVLQQRRGDLVGAEENYRRGLAIYEETGNRASVSGTLNNMAELFNEQGKYERALETAKRAIDLAKLSGSQQLLPTAHGSAGKAYRALNQPDKARQEFESALGAAESMRLNVGGQDARALFFAGVQAVYEPYVDFLIERNSAQPSENFASLALEVNERARARSLLDALNETRANITQGVRPDLLERERGLRERLGSYAERQTRANGEVASDLQKEIARLTAEYQDVQAQIRKESPRYAELTQPEPLKLREIQEQILDRDTVLLEYALGEKRSHLWAVSKNTVDVYTLPARAEIETTVKSAYAHLSDGGRARDPRSEAGFRTATRQLSKQLLAPAAARFKGKRILIVADGVLQYLPFGSLPDPNSTSKPLIAGSEVINLPSASTLVYLRRHSGARAKATKSIAIFADPVFSPTDERVASAAAKVSKPHIQESAAERSAGEMGATRDGGIQRLPFSRREAESIVAVVPGEQEFQALDFQASRENALAADVTNYRVIHFASHGLLHSRHPELSGIVLSLVNEKGEPINGFLRLNDIYNMNLNADLVVLSACQTALGKEVRGEGLIGLTRGFMYAGSPRVVASLWKVDDVATAELMKIFYQKMLKENMRPAAALREAKITLMKQKRWSSPYYWAAFELHGDWR